MLVRRVRRSQRDYWTTTDSAGLTVISRILAGRLKGSSRLNPLGLFAVREKKLDELLDKRLWQRHTIHLCASELKLSFTITRA